MANYNMTIEDNEGNVYLPEVSEDQIKSGFAQNLAASGWKKLPGGLIIQWGQTRTIKASGYILEARFNFPIVFSSTPRLVASAIKGSNSYIECVSTNGLGTITPSSGVAKVMNQDGGFKDESYLIDWVAVGY